LNNGEKPNNEPLTQGLLAMATEALKLSIKLLSGFVA
jgi:hypothetical protein